MKSNIHRTVAVAALAFAAATMPFSVRLCHWSLLVFLFNWIVAGEWKEKAALLSASRFWWLMPLYFLVCLTGMLYTDNATSGWQKIETKATFLLIPIMVASSPTLGRKHLGLVVRVFILACTAASLYCIGHSFWIASGAPGQSNFSAETLDAFYRFNPDAAPAWMAFSYASLASGVGLHPTYFGMYLVLCLLMLQYFFRDEELAPFEKRVGKWLFVFLFIFIFFLSSRIAMLAAVGAVVSAMVFRGAGTSGKSLNTAGVIAIIVGALILWVNPVSRFRGLQEPFSASSLELPPHTTSSIDTRVSLLRLSSYASPHANPFIGSGTGTGEDRLRVEGETHHMTNVLGTYDPHNQYVYTFLELGVVGLAALLAMIIPPLYTAIRRGSRLLAGLLLLVAAVCLTESALELQKGIVLFTFFGSLLLFHAVKHEEKTRPHD